MAGKDRLVKKVQPIQQDRKPRLKRYFKIALLGIIVLSFVFSLNQLKFSREFPIRTVRVAGLAHIDPNEIKTLLTPLVNEGFFNVNVDSIRERLLQLPWIYDLYVRRTWPDRVDVVIVEKNPVARWGDQYLLSETGELFSPKLDTFPSDLPQVYGPMGEQMEILQYFKDINRILMRIHAKIASLEETPYLLWKLVLDNGIALYIGNKDVLARLDEFVQVYPQVVGERAEDVDYIDLRYPNGMAVRWKKAKTA